MNREKPPIPAAVLLFVGITAISFSSIFVKWSNAPVSIQAMYRLVFTVLLMLPFGVKYIPYVRKVGRTDFLKLIASGMMLAAHFLLWMGSLQWTSVASSTMILALQPVFVMIGAYIFFKERTSASALYGMGIAFVGVFVLIGNSGVSGTGNHLKGDLMSLLGTAAIAVHMLLGQMLLKRMPSFLYSWFVFVFAALLLAGYNVVSNIPMTGYSANDWGIFLLLAIVPTVFGQLLFNWLMRYLSASTVSMSVLGEPVGASLLAFLLLHESINGLQAIGGAFVMFGLILFLNVKSSSKTQDQVPTDLQTESLG
ncbi:DMT family transporter [Paenibacillus faecalis]|uniref:DMT family transporter n=1 Tax=Paenibacillus faecalis TaxID=2079532 RepID=UPI000D0E9C5A|nr:DMT family transporter [Paenibacillus faecalis]